jgi:hypothetical protein
MRALGATADETMLDLLWALAVLLVVLWAVGASFHALGAAIHGLLVLAVATGALRIVIGRRSARSKRGATVR